MTVRALMAGGGTGGHVYPALAVAEALSDVGAHVAFVGTDRGLEATAVPAAGFPLRTVDAAPFRRTLSVRTLAIPWVVGHAARRVARLIRAERISVACTFGGYVSGPLALAAWLTRTPLVLHEQNAVPGLANRIAARWARTVAASVPGTAERFPRPDRVVVTGNPVRRDFLAAAGETRRAEALAAFGLDPGRRTLLAFGGSLGARRINDAIVGSAARWADPGRLQILHASGRRDHERVTAAWEAARGSGVADLRVCHQPYIDRMDLAYAAADVAVCRAGATSLAELTVLGLPSVLVPYPHAAADEQTANARALAAAGAATMVADADLDAASLVAACEGWLTDDERHSHAVAAARALGRPDAAERVAELVVAAADTTAASAGGSPSRGDHPDD